MSDAPVSPPLLRLCNEVVLLRERSDRQKIDDILAKVSAHGMSSLTWLEKRTLRQASESQRQRDAEMSQILKK